MQIQEQQLYNLQETADFLKVGKTTLRAWDRNGYFKAGKTQGKHRRYLGKEILLKMKEMMES